MGRARKRRSSRRWRAAAIHGTAARRRGLADGRRPAGGARGTPCGVHCGGRQPARAARRAATRHPGGGRRRRWAAFTGHRLVERILAHGETSRACCNGGLQADSGWSRPRAAALRFAFHRLEGTTSLRTGPSSADQAQRYGRSGSTTTGDRGRIRRGDYAALGLARPAGASGASRRLRRRGWHAAAGAARALRGDLHMHTTAKTAARRPHDGGGGAPLASRIAIPNISRWRWLAV